MITTIPIDANAPAILAAIEEPYHQWINGSEVIIYTGEDMPPAPIPAISAWQMRKALNATGLRDQIEAAVAGASRDVQDGWATAREFERNHPLIVQMASALDLSDAEVDAVFELGATL